MTLRLKLVHKKNEIQVAIPPHEAVKETFGDLKVRLHCASRSQIDLHNHSCAPNCGRGFAGHVLPVAS